VLRIVGHASRSPQPQRDILVHAKNNQVMLLIARSFVEKQQYWSVNLTSELDWEIGHENQAVESELTHLYSIP
jgi:hypothetical protein